MIALGVVHVGFMVDKLVLRKNFFPHCLSISISPWQVLFCHCSALVYQCRAVRYGHLRSSTEGLKLVPTPTAKNNFVNGQRNNCSAFALFVQLSRRE